MNISIIGAAGFIGKNLLLKLANNVDCITVVDKDVNYFSDVSDIVVGNVIYKQSNLDNNCDFDELTRNQNVVYHLVSTTVPSTSNQKIAEELSGNVVFTSMLMDACVKNGVEKVIFISSGGTVYGKDAVCPISENSQTFPINSYGVQKLAIEKILYLYNYMYGIDYRIIRLANPYGPYQRPNGILGAVTTFTYKALIDEEIQIFGDGSVIRDYIFIDDAIRGIINIANYDGSEKLFNLGSGQGESLRQVLEALEKVMGKTLNVKYSMGRAVDVPSNYLDISLYEKECGALNPISLEDGIRKTIEFMKKEYLK